MINGVEDILWDDKGDGDWMHSENLSISGYENIHVDSGFRSTEETSMGGYFISPQGAHPSSYKEVEISKGLEPSPQGGSAESYEEESGPVGLKLSKTPSFINLIERELNRLSTTDPGLSSSYRQQETKKAATDKEEEKLDRENLKPSNFPALYLSIGNWEKSSGYEGDLVAKCYYVTKKLVWEILEGDLKSKIEIKFEDIIGIRVSKTDDECAVLEVELNEKPVFRKETNPQPRKHTTWEDADDFTGGEALRYRRHYVKFAQGTLDKHYERLMQYDKRLYALSQRHFPSKDSPYFSNVCVSPQLSRDFNAYDHSNFHPTIQSPYDQSLQAHVPSSSYQIVRPQVDQFMDLNPTMPVSNMALDNSNMVYQNEYLATCIPNGNYIQAAMQHNMNFPNYSNMGFLEQVFTAISQGQGRGQGQVTGLSMIDQRVSQDQVTELSTALLTPHSTLLDIQNFSVADIPSFNDEIALVGGDSMCSSMLPFEIVPSLINEQMMIQNNNGESLEGRNLINEQVMIQNNNEESFEGWNLINEQVMIQNSNGESLEGWNLINEQVMRQNNDGESLSIPNHWLARSTYSNGLPQYEENVEIQPSTYYLSYLYDL